MIIVLNVEDGTVMLVNGVIYKPSKILFCICRNSPDTFVPLNLLYNNYYSSIINIYFYETFSTLTQTFKCLRSTL